ncbi:LOW QUALITY PROTEIN: hypothetical protein QYF61_004698 [Mycteria americana]|uniref:Uncharacterized protein n=1 Tax=Mycteria americana TaxID=33587 RepID=A0AAN7NNH9_MYCAM|nr:LOW QUALITY PROTEIN: hypothetical protein QYF61_004698 [Mycteria americana]
MILKVFSNLYDSVILCDSVKLLLRAPSNLTLNVSRDGASTTSLGNLFQCFTTLIVKNFFLQSSLNLPSLSLKLLLLVLSQQALLKSLSPSLLEAPFKDWKAVIRSPRSLLFSRLNNPSSLSLSLEERCSSPRIIFVALLWPCSSSSMSFLAPELDAGLQARSHQSRVEGQNHLPRPAGHAAFDAAQDTVGLLGCKRTSLAHVQLFVHQYPQVLSCRAALDHIIPQPLLIPGVALTQNPALGLVEPHEVHTGPLLQLVQVPLDDIPSFWRVNCTTQLGVICKLAEGALDLAVNVIDENTELHWSQYGPLRDHLSLISIWTLSR